MMLVCPHFVSASHAVIWNRSLHTYIYVKRDGALGLAVADRARGSVMCRLGCCAECSTDLIRAYIEVVGV